MTTGPGEEPHEPEASEEVHAPSSSGEQVSEESSEEQVSQGVSGRAVAVLVAVAVVTGLVAGGLGGWISARMTASDASSASAGSDAASAEQVQASNVGLCVEYLAMTRSIPNPADAAGPVLTGVNGLRWALANNPDASTEIRDAVRAVIDEYDGLIISSTNVSPPGIATGDEPLSTYNPVTAQQAVNHVLDLCQFDGPRP